VSDFSPKRVEDIAKVFHYSYAMFAPALGWAPQEGTSGRWEDLPDANRQLMLVVVTDMLNRGIIR
jgi:hypothetical protein